MDAQTFVVALQTSLSASPQRKEAEAWLQASATLPGSLPLALQIIASEQFPSSIRQSAAAWLKNSCRSLWCDAVDESPLSAQDNHALKTQLVPLTISLSNQPSVQALLAEAVSIISQFDFPQRWPELIDQLIAGFSPTDFAANVGVLDISHSVFLPWRSQTRNDELFTAIKYALEKFCPTYLQVFRKVDELLQLPQPPVPVPLLGRTLVSLTYVFHDLNSQDLPEFFEDNIQAFMGSSGTEGLMLRYLRWERPELITEDDDAPGTLQKLRASICEIAELYVLKYHEEFTELKSFVIAIWELLGTLSPLPRDDQLVNQALHFLGVVVKMGIHRDLFDNQDVLRGFCERIILPNMVLQENEEEMFEDDPLEYIRRDLETATDATTRRQSATEFTRSLMEQFESQVTTIIGYYINSYLEKYQSNPSENWKDKDTAVCLLTGIASRGGTAQQGVTSTNALVDVVSWFGQHILPDLQAAPDTVNPILQVDGIKFLHAFRNQLTKDQLVSVLPLLVHHLSSSNYVCSSYAAIAIERILFIKKNNQLAFNPTDIQDLAPSILAALFAKIKAGGTPEKVAENDYLMKCVMRVIMTDRQTLLPIYQDALSSLADIVGVISKNPSNPLFSQFCFESLSALIRFITAASPPTVSHFEIALFPPITFILQTDVVDFMPYAYQILSQLLEAHSGELPPDYSSLLRDVVLNPASWQSKGNVPALARLLKAFLLRGGKSMAATGALKSIFGLIQQRLLASRLYDVYGFEILQSILLHVPSNDVQPYIGGILMSILSRLQGPRLANLYYYWTYFLCFSSAIEVEGMSPDFILNSLNGIQPGLLTPVLQTTVAPEVTRMQPRDRKLVAVGLTKLLTRCPVMLTAPTSTAWSTLLTALLQLFSLPESAARTQEDVVEIEIEAVQEGYQASFSKLAASEPAKVDPVAYVSDPRVFLSQELARLALARPDVVRPLVAQVPNELSAPFIQFMAGNGHSL